MESIEGNPLLVRPHTMAVPKNAIENDTKFLMDHHIMDYLLLLGIENSGKELVVGILDYLRTFTWDKKLEMYVNSSGILGGN